MKRQDAPGDLEHVRAFLNTDDREHHTDALTTPADAATWLGVPGLTTAEHTRVLRIRDALRAHADADPDATTALDELAADADVRARLTPHGTTISPAPHRGVTTALGRLLAITVLATLDGTWPRLKICPADDCRWAFYDHSKNRSGRWCQMAECGNRAKARTYRRTTKWTGTPAPQSP